MQRANQLEAAPALAGAEPENRPPARTILMVTIGYPPDQIGGTEIYVQGLVEALRAHDYRCEIAYIEPFDSAHAPDLEIRTRDFDATPVHVIRVNRSYHKLEFLYFDAAARERLLQAFDRVVDQVAPDIVHVHPLVLSFESYLIAHLKARGRKVVLTYHSSTTGCVRGDLVYLGKTVCDGRIRQSRCTTCLYHRHGVPVPAALVLARLPLAVARGAFHVADRLPWSRRLRSFFSLPLIVEAGAHAWARATRHADAVVAVCQWVRDVIVRNSVPADKVTLSRHGLRIRGDRVHGTAPSGVTCFGYLGRIGPEKGIGVLLDALESIDRNVRYQLEFCSATFRRTDLRPDERRLIERIERLAATDPRVVVLGHVPDDELGNVLARWDALVVPSLWLESGPQVVYEAFSVRTPVIGSDLGGIRELVEHGQTGLLVPPNDVAALRNILVECATEPAKLRALRKYIRTVRSTDAVAADMSKLYDRLLLPSREA